LSKDVDKESAVHGSLSSGSVIVYVWRQRDAELIAEYINMSGNIVGGVVVYHGGMASDDRIKAQSKVSFDEIRVLISFCYG
jgi:ATP-dependent DNA helicase Q4